MQLPADPDDHDAHDREIQRQNLIALAFVSLLALGGFWLVDHFRQQVKLEECLEARHRNCAPLDIDQNK